MYTEKPNTDTDGKKKSNKKEKSEEHKKRWSEKHTGKRTLW